MKESTRTAIIGGLVLLVAGIGIYKVLQLTGEPVKKKLSGVDSVRDQYNELTDNNDHSAAALLLAKNFGTKKEINIISKIKEQHDKKGRITLPEQKLRDKIASRLYKKLPK